MDQMSTRSAVLAHDWLGACRSAAEGLRKVLADTPLSIHRVLETGDPRWLAARSLALVDVAHRIRAIGSIAISLCQVAATRVDGMTTLWNCRAVDAAAGQLVVRESGGMVAFTACHPPP